ncbi:helix-turn-helix domain-containing protein [Enterobacter oligotrophicus]|uniref:helix-turn-helix domain-containing protein n=2 Tax=Enterobacter oligotrophicus TaxID=2478464 RepID=UPI0023EF577B|nr:helix-turn-helix domain-containing protein [Enterobacter oligotrophicus]
MSSKLHGLVWEGCAQAGLGISRVALMARIADYSNAEGVSWPAIETLQIEIGAKSETTVKNALAELVSGGWINKIERKVGGRNLTNIYQINIEKLEAAAAVGRKKIKEKRARKKSSRCLPAGQEGQGAIFNPSNNAPSNDENKGANFDGSNFEGSKIGEKDDLTPPKIAPDPSLTTDPSLEEILTSENSGESSDDENLSKPSESSRKVKWGSAEDHQCAEWIFNRIRKLYEKAAETDGEVSRPKEPNWESWANDIRLMRTIDGRTHRQICDMFKRVQADKFWIKNVLSPAKLREKWDELVLKLSPANLSEGQGVMQSSYQNTDYRAGDLSGFRISDRNVNKRNF